MTVKEVDYVVIRSTNGALIEFFQDDAQRIYDSYTNSLNAQRSWSSEVFYDGEGDNINIMVNLSQVMIFGYREKKEKAEDDHEHIFE